MKKVSVLKWNCSPPEENQGKELRVIIERTQAVCKYLLLLSPGLVFFPSKNCLKSGYEKQYLTVLLCRCVMRSHTFTKDNTFQALGKVFSKHKFRDVLGM
jgi:hypothetical protein